MYFTLLVAHLVVVIECISNERILNLPTSAGNFSPNIVRSVRTFCQTREPDAEEEDAFGSASCITDINDCRVLVYPTTVLEGCSGEFAMIGVHIIILCIVQRIKLAQAGAKGGVNNEMANFLGPAFLLATYFRSGTMIIAFNAQHTKAGE